MISKFPLNPTKLRTNEIVLSTRARYARNLEAFSFPGAPINDTELLISVLTEAFELKGMKVVLLSEMSSLERQKLAEEWIISSDLADSETPCGLVRDDARGLYIMINEEDHLRIQCIRRGYDPTGAFATLKKFDIDFGESIDYAYSENFGFLTACPSNLGTGFRISALVQLTGLQLTLGLEQALNAIDRLRFNIRGSYGEDSEKRGSMYQISNRETLGMTEEFILERFQSFMTDLIRREHHARYRLLNEQSNLLKDAVLRALATVLYATHYSVGEDAFEPLSVLRFGVALGVVKNLKLEDMDRLLLLIRFAHLVEFQKEAKIKSDGMHPCASVIQYFLREKGFYKGTPPDFVTL